MEEDEVYVNVDNPRDHYPPVVQRAINVERSIFIAAAVCLTALCVLLAVRTTDRVMDNHSAIITELQTTYDNMTLERDQWKSSYDNMTLERDQWKSSYDNMTLERDQLKSSYDNMTLERDQLKTSNNMTIEVRSTTAQTRDQLKTSYDNMTLERDQWKSSYDNMTLERDQLKTSNNMTLERDQLKTSYDNVIRERDQLKTSYGNVIQEKNKLQSEINQLKREIAAGERVSAWNNCFDEPLYVVCPNGSAVAQIASEHHNHHEDRKWKVGCKSAVEFSDCYWSGFTNDLDQPFDFQCRLNYVMAGMSSHHDNDSEDRRWKYFCCTAPGLTLSKCLRTPEVNDWDADFNWQVPGARDYVTGAASHHDNHYEDRRWSFRYCSAN